MRISVHVSSRLEDYLDKALALDGAEKGGIQVFRKETETLEYVAHKGLPPSFISHFKIVKPFDSSACGRALGIGSPVLISDVKQDLGFAAHLNIAREAGFRAVKSVPLRCGSTVLGVISTHYQHPQWQWDLTKIRDLVQELSGYLATLVDTADFRVDMRAS